MQSGRNRCAGFRPLMRLREALARTLCIERGIAGSILTSDSDYGLRRDIRCIPETAGESLAGVGSRDSRCTPESPGAPGGRCYTLIPDVCWYWHSSVQPLLGGRFHSGSAPSHPRFWLKDDEGRGTLYRGLFLGDSWNSRSFFHGEWSHGRLGTPGCCQSPVDGGSHGSRSRSPVFYDPARMWQSAHVREYDTFGSLQGSGPLHCL